MKKDACLKDLHIGSMIKEMARRKRISSEKLASLIFRYQGNADKIYRMDDMDIEDVIRISHLMEYNFLEIISDKCLPHLPVIENRQYEDGYYMELDVKTGYFSFTGGIGKPDALQKIHIGQHIRSIADENRWNEQYMARQLRCSQSYVSYLYQQKSLKLKILIRISKALKHNLIAEAYLSRMFIVSSPEKFAGCIVTITSQEVCIENPDDKTFLMVFRRMDDEKQRKMTRANRTNIDKKP